MPAVNISMSFSNSAEAVREMRAVIGDPQPGFDMPEFMKSLIQRLARIAKGHGVPLGHALWTALDIQKNARDEYHRGVLSCVAYIYADISRTAEGRKALLDLGFQPFFEDRESPGHGGADD